MSPFVYSFAPSRDPDGSEQTAKIAVDPFRPEPVAISVKPVEESWVPFILSLDEAEALASRLAEVVAAAKAGNFTGSHEDLRSVWAALTDEWAVLAADYHEHLYGSSL